MTMEKKELRAQALDSLGKITPPLPANHGKWKGERGNSAWKFDLDAIRQDVYSDNPHDRARWGDMIAISEYPNGDRVVFRKKYPDFSPYVIVVTSDNRSLKADFRFPSIIFTKYRENNYRLADGWVAEKLGAAVDDVIDLRTTNKYAWHEVQTCTQMLLVPRVFHNLVSHGGGIEVMKQGGPDQISGSKADAPLLEERVVAGRNALCGGGLCRTRQSFRLRGIIEDVRVVCYCVDDNGTPTQPQLGRMRYLEENLAQVEEKVWDAVQRYADEEWGETLGAKCGETARLTLIQIFPKNAATGEIDVGFYYDNFAGDMEHGLGARLRGDKIIDVGSGDVAL